MMVINSMLLLTTIAEKELDIVSTIAAVIFIIVAAVGGILVAIRQGRITVRSVIKNPNIIKDVVLEAIEEAQKKLGKAQAKGDDKQVEKMTHVLHTLETIDAAEIQRQAAEKAAEPKIDKKEEV